MSPVPLEPWQHRVVELLLDQQNRLLICNWGRNCGKTAIKTELMRRLAERASRESPLSVPPNVGNSS